MRILRQLNVLVLILVAALVAIPVLASDVSDADYYGTIRVTNNGTATTIVSTNVSGLHTDQLIAAGFLNSGANNTAIQYGGADVAFMPGYQTNPWAIFVPSISANTTLNDILYTGNVSGGKLRYFPNSAGMTTADNASLEMSNNATYEISTYLGSTSGNITGKTDAFNGYWNATTGNVTFKINNGADHLPTGAADGAGGGFGPWGTPANAIDDSLATQATCLSGGGGWSNYIELSHASIEITGVKFYLDAASHDPDNCEVALYYDGAWHNVYTADPAIGAWVSTIPTYSANQTITNARIRFNFTGIGTIRLDEFHYITPTEVTGASTTGEHTIRLSIEDIIPVTTLSTRVNSASDDAGVFWNVFQWLFDTAYPTAGYSAANSYKAGAGYVFDNITIPSGVIIDSANLTFNSWGNWALNNVNTRITGEDTDNATTFSDLANFQARTHTTANITWDAIGAWLNNTNYNSPELSTIIQEIVDRPGWQSGSNMALFWEDFEDRSTHVNGTERDSTAYENGSSRATLLNITYHGLGNLVITIDGVEVGSTPLVEDFTVPNNSNNWTDGGDATPYIEYVKRWVGGNLKQWVQWEYGATFTDLSGNSNTATPSFRTTSSDADVSAELITFQPVEVPIAPPWSVGTGPDFISTNVTMTGNFTSGNSTILSYPGKGIVAALSAAGSTPEYFPTIIIATFLMIAAGLAISHFLRENNALSLFLKFLVYSCGYALLIALHINDWWMWVLFAFLCFPLMFGSHQRRLG